MVEIVGTCGERIVVARGVRRMSQQSLGAKIGYHPMSVSRWERGTVAPRIAALAAIAYRLGLRLDWLIKGEGPMDITP